MSLRLPGLIPLAMLATAAADPPPPPAITAREAMERQLAAPARPAPALSAAEAARIRELYLARIGQKLEPPRETGGGRSSP